MGRLEFADEMESGECWTPQTGKLRLHRPEALPAGRYKHTSLRMINVYCCWRLAERGGVGIVPAAWHTGCDARQNPAYVATRCHVDLADEDRSAICAHN